MPWVRRVSLTWVPPEDHDPWHPQDGERVILPTHFGDIPYRVRWEPLVGGGAALMLHPVKQAPIREDLACKLCGSKNLVRFGTHGGVQRYMCHECGRTFMDNGAMPGMKTPPEAIGAAVSMFYGGLSIRDVSWNLDQIFGLQPSKSTIYGWIVRYTKVAAKIVGDAPPKVGDVWVADETVLKIGGHNLWFFDCIDEQTRYLLASRIATTRTTREATELFKRAVWVADKRPRTIVTDKLASYVDGIERAVGAGPKHHQSGPFALERSTRSIERFHGTLKDRTKIMRGLTNKESAKLVLDGWSFHYNHFRAHEGLGGETPGRVASIASPVKNWAEVVSWAS